MSAIAAGQSRSRPGAVRAGFGTWLGELPRLAAVSAAVWVPYQLLQVLLFTAFGVATSASTIDAAATRVAAGEAVADGALGGAIAALSMYGLVSMTAALVALSIAQGALSLVADAGLRGERVAVTAALDHGAGRLGAVAGTNLVVALLILAVEIALAIAVAAVAFLAGLAGLAPVATGVGAIALLVAPVIVFARVATAPQSAALDGLGPVPAVRLAYAELRHHAALSLGVVILAGAVAWLGAFLLQALAGAVLPGRAAALVAAIVAAVLLGPLPQVMLTALHRRASPPA